MHALMASYMSMESKVNTILVKKVFHMLSHAFELLVMAVVTIVPRAVP